MELCVVTLVLGDFFFHVFNQSCGCKSVIHIAMEYWNKNSQPQKSRKRFYHLVGLWIILWRMYCAHPFISLLRMELNEYNIKIPFGI